MKDTVTTYENKKEFHLFVEKTYFDLARSKAKDDGTEFNALLLQILPEVKRYITKKLNTALAKGLISKNKYKAEGIKNQLFIEVYDHFDEIESAQKLRPWLFKKADKLLDEILTEEEFDELFFKNIDDYSKAEWDAMEEEFSTDGDGDLVMLNELADISYRQKEFILDPIFVKDGKKDMIAKLDIQLDNKALERHRDLVLRHLPMPMRDVFELATEYQFDLEHIANIRNQSQEKVLTLLEAARKFLEVSFINRYDISK
jgi:DNA-directed RNA polymerase specialized sigma24 family protein